MMNGLGAKLREERKRRGLTLEDVAKGTNVSGSYISQLEREERNPSLENYLNIISFLGVDFTYFLNTEENDIINIGREIKALREKNDMSIGDLRDASGVEFFQIGRAENGEIELTEEELTAIATVFDVDVSYFYSRYEYNISKIIAASKSLGLKDNDIELLVSYINDCLKKKNKEKAPS